MSVETTTVSTIDQEQWTEEEVQLARDNVAQLNHFLDDKPPSFITPFMLKHFGSKRAHAVTSAGLTAVVLLDNIERATDSATLSNLPVLHTDTGFLPPQVPVYRDYLADQFGFQLDIRGPSPEEISMIKQSKLYETDVDEYRRLTKYGPLDEFIKERAVRLLFTGVRRDQTQNRDELAIVTFGSNGELRVNPNFHTPKYAARRAVGEIISRRAIQPHPLEGKISFVDDAPFILKPKTECGINSARRLVRPPIHVMEDLVALKLPAA